MARKSHDIHIRQVAKSKNYDSYIRVVRDHHRTDIIWVSFHSRHCNDTHDSVCEMLVSVQYRHSELTDCTLLNTPVLSVQLRDLDLHPKAASCNTISIVKRIIQTNLNSFFSERLELSKSVRSGTFYIRRQRRIVFIHRGVVFP